MNVFDCFGYTNAYTVSFSTRLQTLNARHVDSRLPNDHVAASLHTQASSLRHTRLIVVNTATASSRTQPTYSISNIVANSLPPYIHALLLLVKSLYSTVSFQPAVSGKKSRHRGRHHLLHFIHRNSCIPRHVSCIYSYTPQTTSNSIPQQPSRLLFTPQCLSAYI